MNEDAVSLVDGFFYKLEGGVEDFVLGVEDDLVLIVDPMEVHVLDSNVLPVVGELFGCAVDDALDFVGDHKLQVLGGELIAEEESVLDFDGSYEFELHD